jgi:dephospho-CoA kinase
MERSQAAGPVPGLVIRSRRGGRRDHVDRVLVVDVPEATQIERLVRRDGVTREQAEAALRAQASREARLAFADDVIENTGDLAELGGRVALLHEKYLKLATRPAP